MKVTSLSALRGDRAELPLDEVTLVNRDGVVIGAFVPADIWFQIQSFVGRVIERV